MSEVNEFRFRGEVKDNSLEKEAVQQLEDLGLEWKNLEGKKVLEIGAGRAKIGQVAKKKGLEYVSFDVRMPPEGVPEDINYVQARAAALPFKEESFDLVLSHSAPPIFPVKAKHLPEEERWPVQEAGIIKTIQEALRVLKKGGEFRFSPGPLTYLYRLSPDKELFSFNEQIYLDFKYGRLEKAAQFRGLKDPDDPDGTSLDRRIKNRFGITFDEAHQRVVNMTNEEKLAASDKLEKISLEFLRGIYPHVTQNKREDGRIFYIVKKE